ncbi:MAG: galactose-1-phosphate uridylyltransferase, partial [Ruminococcus sp.]|nr:galactose-1-phosphate uridylyltransferase [Ruminococcus sp.]
MIYESIKKLITYAMDTGLIAEPDRVYCTNRLLEALGLDEYEEPQTEYKDIDLEAVLGELLD